MSCYTDLVQRRLRREDERFHFFLPQTLSKGVERGPSSLDNLGIAVVECDEQYTDEVRVVSREVELGLLEESSEMVVRYGSATAVILINGQKDRVKRALELSLLSFVFATSANDARARALKAEIGDVRSQSVLSLVFGTKQAKQVRQDLVNGTLSNDLLQRVEGLRRSFSDILIRIDKGCAHNRDKSLLIVFKCVGRSGSDKLADGNTDTLPCVAVCRRVERLFERREKSGEHAFAGFANKLAESIACDDLLLHIRAG
ncbi:hypothetical protein KC330_g5 [Hortaea werneckii]|nr:hypothetical protein KC330_g5 [Hortaea werneckii]